MKKKAIHLSNKIAKLCKQIEVGFMMTHDWIEGLWAVAIVAGFSAVYCPLLCWLLASRTTTHA